MKLKPLGDRVIIKQDQMEEKTSSGLYLAGDSKEKPQTGKVIAVGEGRLDKDGKLVPMPVKVGDHVVFSKYGGNEIVCDDQDVLIVRADDIYAVFTKQLICNLFIFVKTKGNK